jgi:hypothetical protein
VTPRTEAICPSVRQLLLELLLLELLLLELLLLELLLMRIPQSLPLATDARASECDLRSC